MSLISINVTNFTFARKIDYWHYYDLEIDFDLVEFTNRIIGWQSIDSIRCFECLVRNGLYYHVNCYMK